MTRIVYSVFAACLFLLATTFAEARVGSGLLLQIQRPNLKSTRPPKDFHPRMNNNQRDAIASLPENIAAKHSLFMHLGVMI